MKKKVMAMVLAAALIFTIAGCGNEKNEQKDNGGKITIDWVPQNDSPVDADSPVIALLEEKFGVDFNFIYMDRNQESELLNVRIAGGEIPDVVQVKDTVYRSYAKQGVLSELPEDTIKQKAPQFYDQMKQYAGEDIWDVVKCSGKLYGMPTLNDTGRYHFVPIWRDDWLRAVGIDKIPETVEEAEVAFYKFVNDDPDGNGKKDTYAMSSHGINAIFNAYGAHPLKYYWTEQDGKIVQSAVLPEMKEALRLLNRYYKDGLIDPEFITGENKGQYWANTPPFINGMIGFSLPGMYYHISATQQDKESATSFWGSFHQLQGENASYVPGKLLKGPEGKFGAERWGVFSGDIVALGKNVGSNSEKLNKILEIQEAINSDFDTYLLARYGRENVDYEVVDGIYETKIDDPKKRQALGLNANGLIRSMSNLEFVKNCDNPEQRRFAEEYANTTDNYSTLVWGGLESDGIYKAIVEQKIQENYYAFITGARSIDEFDQFVEELNKAGLEQLTKEANEWYNERYR